MSIFINNIPITFNAIKTDVYKERLQSEPVTERTGNYDIRNFICDKWEGIKEDGYGTNMNWCMKLLFSNVKGVYFKRDFPSTREELASYLEETSYESHVDFMECFSSPMLLYRSACTFPDSIRIDDMYKTVWTCWLKHKKTGAAFLLSEWKGTPYCGFDSRYRKPKDAPKKYVDDAIEILNYMLSDQCAHPNDHLVAGTQA